MKVIAYMLAFGNKGKIREITIPDNEAVGTQNTILEAAFKYGQNDFQNQQQHPSVSVGDVIQLDSKYFMVMMVGFSEITKDRFEDLVSRGVATSDMGYGLQGRKPSI